MKTDDEQSKLLACLVNVDRGKVHTLSAGQVIIGRESSCGIQIKSDATVSRQHAMLTVIDGIFFVRDLDSRNGTLLNGQKIGNCLVRINPEDKLMVGKTVFVFSPVGISEALYGSQMRNVTAKSRLKLAVCALSEVAKTTVDKLQELVNTRDSHVSAAGSLRSKH